VDRNKKIYQKNVQPDKLIWGGDNFDDYLKDKKIQAALKWLRSFKVGTTGQTAQ
jgi:hypothetical protein